MTLSRIDPVGSSPPGYQNTDKNAPNYASAAFDASCANSLLGGRTTVFTTPDSAVYSWRGEGIRDETNGEQRFIWYHGDPGSYPNSPYGCDHKKMGARGHQGAVTVTVTTEVWICVADIEGSICP